MVDPRWPQSSSDLFFLLFTKSCLEGQRGFEIQVCKIVAELRVLSPGPVFVLVLVTRVNCFNTGDLSGEVGELHLQLSCITQTEEVSGITSENVKDNQN